MFIWSNDFERCFALDNFYNFFFLINYVKLHQIVGLVFFFTFQIKKVSVYKWSIKNISLGIVHFSTHDVKWTHACSNIGIFSFFLLVILYFVHQLANCMIKIILILFEIEDGDWRGELKYNEDVNIYM